jgi:hypothetical protein
MLLRTDRSDVRLPSFCVRIQLSPWESREGNERRGLFYDFRRGGCLPRRLALWSLINQALDNVLGGNAFGLSGEGSNDSVS